MGKIDVVVNRYCSDTERFADLFNGVFFEGRQVVKPEELTLSSQVYRQTPIALEQESGEGRPPEKELFLERTRDIKMTNRKGIAFRILAVESENKVDYGMPFRMLQYDVMEYQQQVNKIRQRNSWGRAGQRKEPGKLRKTDRLWPVYTLCVYYGTKKWDGPRSLRDMMDFGTDEDGMSEFFADYPFRLLCVNEMEDFSMFQSQLQDVFRLMQCRKDKEKMLQLLEESPKYRELDEETLELLAVVVDEPRIWEKRNKYKQEGGYNMCKAWKEMKRDARNEGILEGSMKTLIETCQELSQSYEATMERVMERFKMSREEVVGQMEKYWV
ncbi:MAG: Rpn family recombination-promoting nuclease/putative transposase [Lachnospiraceae bacterium]|nr:Rpn family recombination-promoting nuclease/putative transposase [Lachnospiraceae bacterium]